VSSWCSHASQEWRNRYILHRRVTRQSALRRHGGCGSFPEEYRQRLDSHMESPFGPRQWRRSVKTTFGIPTTRELHGVKLASGRGNYYKGKYNFSRPRAGAVYRGILSMASFLPDGSVLSRSARRPSYMYGSERLEAALYALFQRIRRQCIARDVNAIVFFDEGHPEYDAAGACSQGMASQSWPRSAFRRFTLADIRIGNSFRYRLRPN
jgi:hypothetical protein